MTQEQENFYRHSTVIVDETKDSFLHLLDFYLTNQGITLQRFIEINGHDIYHLCFNCYPCCQCPPGTRAVTRGSRVLHPPQLDILFDKTGSKLPGHNPGSKSAPHCCCPVNPNLQLHDLDFTLARFLLVNFTTLVPQGSPERSALDFLANSRNHSFAHAKEGKIPNSEYQKSMADVEASLLVLAKVYNKEAETKQRLRDIAKQPLNIAICLQLQNTLLQQCQLEETIKRLLPEKILPECLTRDLEDIRVIEGNDAKFEFWTKEHNIIAEWFTEDNKTDVSDKFVFETSGVKHTLVVRNADLTDRGIYTAKFEGYERSARLDIDEYFTKNLRSTYEYIEGDIVELSCAVLEDNVTAHWEKDGVGVQHGDRYTITDEGKNHKLTIQHINLQDAGDYCVKICDRMRSTSLNVKAFIKENKSEKGITNEENEQCLEHMKCINHICTEHIVAICDDCLGIYHNQCTILEMTLALASYQKLRQSIKSMLKKKLNRLQNVNEDLKQELSIRDKLINVIASNLKKSYEAMKEQFMHTTIQNENNLLSALKELDERKSNLEKILDNVNDSQLDVSTTDNLLSMYKLNKITEENIENFEKMCKKESLSKVNQNVDIVVAGCNKRLIDFALYPIRDTIYLNTSLVLLKSLLVKPYRKPNFIRSCTFGSSDEMCFVDSRNDRLVIAKSNSEQSSIPLPGRPFDVKNGDQGFIVTLRQNRSICFVEQIPNANSTISAEEVKFRNTGSIGGISRAGDHVIMAVECFGFYILDLKGEIKNKIAIQDDINIQYVASTNNKILYTKSDENRVYCCDYRGNTLWMFEDAKRMTTPTGITVDEDGCVYVSCLSSNNVLIISPDGQFGKELISSIDGFKRIHAIDYNVVGKTLLICAENGEARVYKLNKSTLD